MDLIFDVEGGGQFTIEIGYFDSIPEIKEKVQKYQGIPANNQTLIWDGKVLPDDFDIHNSDIVDRSHIQLVVAAAASDSEQQHLHVAEEPSPPSPPEDRLILINLKLLKGEKKPDSIGLEVDVTYTVRKLKEIIGEDDGIPVSGITVYANGIELLDDDRTLHDCQISDDSELVVSFKQQQQQLNVAATGSAEEPPPPPADGKSIMIILKIQLGADKADVSLEVNVTDTVRKLKVMTGGACGIPASRIAVYADGIELLDDDWTLHDYQISNHSQVVVSFKSILIILKMQLGADKADVSLEVNVTDTVRKLKEIIGEAYRIPANRIAVYAKNGIELSDDDRTLHDYQISDHSEVVVRSKPLPATTTAAGSSRNTNKSKKLIRIMVKSQYGKMFPVEVNPSENVEELRKEIEKLKEKSQLELPKEDYFFIHKQSPMDEDRSFRSHNVARGDLIEMFNGNYR